MKKHILFSILIILCINTAFGQDKNQAINDYLQTIVPDYKEELIFIKEKVSPNVALDIFYGRPYTDSDGNFKKDERGPDSLYIESAGAPDSLFNEIDWEKMKKENFDKKIYQQSNFTENTFWNLNDFKYKNIIFVLHKDLLDLTISRSEKRLPTIKVFYFSMPMYYSNDKYLIFAVSKGDSEATINYDNYVVIMKKEKDKWIVVTKVNSPGYQ